MLMVALIFPASGFVFAQTQSPDIKPSAAVPLPSSLPANQSTERADDSDAPASPPQQPAQRFKVDYAAGQVAVDATNASLTQVVREVARKASIKVTGNVADERVFGHYGPSAPSTVLAALLDGTGSNMLLVDDAKGSSELILTARRGSATPPNPNVTEQEADADAPEERPAPQYPTPAFRPPLPTGRGPVNANPDGSPAAPAASDDSSDATPQANGQRTPQQIYEQLQKMMQQRQPAATPAPDPQD